jgi:hypothetical protein
MHRDAFAAWNDDAKVRPSLHAGTGATNLNAVATAPAVTGVVEVALVVDS